MWNGFQAREIQVLDTEHHKIMIMLDIIHLEKRVDFRERLPLEYPLSTIFIRVVLSSLKIPLFQL